MGFDWLEETESSAQESNVLPDVVDDVDALFHVDDESACTAFNTAHSPLCPGKTPLEIEHLKRHVFDRFVYLDNNATHPVLPEVKSSIKDAFNIIGNASSSHMAGERARAYLEESRTIIADYLSVSPAQILFTASGSESNNTVIKGLAFKQLPSLKLNKIVTTSFEHKAVLSVVEYLRKFGFSKEIIQPTNGGVVDPMEIERCVDRHTLLVSVMHANNELGTLLPVKECAGAAHRRYPDVFFHTDMSQSLGKTEVPKLCCNGVDAATITAHKFGGPTGVSALFIRDKERIDPLIHGGNQEFQVRAGTYNVPLIAGMAEAVKHLSNVDSYLESMKKVRDYMERKLVEVGCTINCKDTERLANTSSVIIPGVVGEQLMKNLSEEGIFISTSSACNSHVKEPSYVLKAIGLTDEQSYNTIRISLNRFTTMADVDLLIERIRVYKNDDI